MSGCRTWSVGLFSTILQERPKTLYMITLQTAWYLLKSSGCEHALSLFPFLERPTIGPIRACQGHLPSIRSQSLFFSPQLRTERWKADRSTPILVQNTCSCTTSQGPLSLISFWKQMWKQFPWKCEQLKILQFPLDWNSLCPPVYATSHLLPRVQWITEL